MLFSGADLVKNSANLESRLSQVGRKAEAPAAVEPMPSGPSKEDTANALLRFAKFVKGETEEKKKKPRNLVPILRKVPTGKLAKFAKFSENRGQILDIHV